MKELIILLCFTISLIFACLQHSENISASKSENFEDGTTSMTSPWIIGNSYRYGPILLKINDDWLIEENGKKYLIIGLNKKPFTEIGSLDDYIDLSLNSLSQQTTEYDLRAEKLKSEEVSIKAYKLEVLKNHIWVDLQLLIINTYYEPKKVIKSRIADRYDLFFYHPERKKWWGRHYSVSLSSMTNIMFDDLYKENNTKKDIESLLRSTEDEKVKLDIINKRTFNLPSMKFYEENFGDLIERYGMFCWYFEKEEPEKVDPKDDDE